MEQGEKIGRWTLLAYQPGVNRPRREAHWYCQCMCGNQRWVRADNLRSFKSRSCGCLKEELHQAQREEST